VIDTVRREVQRQGQPVELTGTEFELLLLLAREPRQGLHARRDPEPPARPGRADLHTRAVDILVSRLRRKLEPLDCIKTLRNAGYTFAGAPRRERHGASGASAGTPRAWRRHSIRARLVLLFLLLALAIAGVFLFGTRACIAAGWQAWAQPLVADYVDRLAAEIGSPPDAGARRRRWWQRLPITLRIDGPQVQYDSHPGRNDAAGTVPRCRGPRLGAGAPTADGHRLRFGLALPARPERPRRLGWLTLAALLVLTAAGLRPGAAPAAAAGRHRRRRARYRARATSRSPSCTPRTATSWATWPNASTAWRAACTATAGRPARAAAGHQPRAAQPADPRAAERRAGGRRRRQATRCCATWPRCAT
jgi:DNA-binding winged helix-turn-helix (wHTH) protein